MANTEDFIGNFNRNYFNNTSSAKLPTTMNITNINRSLWLLVDLLLTAVRAFSIEYHNLSTYLIQFIEFPR